MRVYSPLFEIEFAVISIHGNVDGDPILVCENKSEGFSRMLFRPYEVTNKELCLWKNKAVEFHSCQ